MCLTSSGTRLSRLGLARPTQFPERETMPTPPGTRHHHLGRFAGALLNPMLLQNCSCVTATRRHTLDLLTGTGYQIVNPTVPTCECVDPDDTMPTILLRSLLRRSFKHTLLASGFQGYASVIGPRTRRRVSRASPWRSTRTVTISGIRGIVDRLKSFPSFAPA